MLLFAARFGALNRAVPGVMITGCEAGGLGRWWQGKIKGMVPLGGHPVACTSFLVVPPGAR
jgi:hypothetical protein